MLIEFRVENHRSLRDEQVLTMEAGRGGDESDPRPRRVAGNPESLLTVAGLYGANASGKSNVLAAMRFMCEAVVRSHRVWPADKGVPRDPFAWGPKRQEPSLFEVTLLLDGVRYQYGFLASDEAFVEEWLYAWPHGKKQVWFERDNGKFRFGENLQGENKLIASVTRPNALYVSVAVQHIHPQVWRVVSWFYDPHILPVGKHVHDHAFGVLTETEVAELFYRDSLDARQRPLLPEKDSPESLRERFRALLKSADVGIVDLRAEIGKVEGSGPRFYFRHCNESDAVWLPLEEQSRGTQTLFYLGWSVVQALQEGGILLVDELERSLHPALARQIIRQFNDPATNPRNAQIIFTTHDTSLLGTTVGEPALRRDQVWLTEKNPEGATVLYPLTDYKPRKAENLERGYLQGRYGAIPFLADFSLAGE